VAHFEFGTQELRKGRETSIFPEFLNSKYDPFRGLLLEQSDCQNLPPFAPAGMGIISKTESALDGN